MPRIVNFEGKTQSFPDDATDAEISAALNAIPAANAEHAPQAKTWTPADSGSVAMAGASAALSPAAQLMAEVGTNPNFPKAMGTAARTAITLGGLGHGVVTGNLPEIVASPIAGWQAGKGGYFLGKGVQSVARPLSDMATKIAPVVQAAAGAQGALDLAQMAEPGRKDIGTFGVGKSADVKNDPAAIERVVKASPSIGDAVANLQQLGLSQGEAVRAVLNLKAKAMR